MTATPFSHSIEIILPKFAITNYSSHADDTRKILMLMWYIVWDQRIKAEINTKLLSRMSSHFYFLFFILCGLSPSNRRLLTKINETFSSFYDHIWLSTSSTTIVAISSHENDTVHIWMSTHTHTHTHNWDAQSLVDDKTSSIKSK